MKQKTVPTHKYEVPWRKRFQVLYVERGEMEIAADARCIGRVYR